jgi:hypothetical protein
MPFLFIDDGCPEANDFADNYVWFDAADPRSVKQAFARRDAVDGESCGCQGTATQEDERALITPRPRLPASRIEIVRDTPPAPCRR